VTKVSVVVPCHNYGRYLPYAIESILTQTYKDLEIIVVDDGSTDSTREVIESYGDRVVRVVGHFGSPNAARNAGIRASTGELVAFLDADDEWRPSKLAVQLRRWHTAKRAGLVYGRCELFEASSGATLGVMPRGPLPEGDVLRELALRQFIPSPTPVIPRRVFEQVGYFDEAERAADDWDMWLRIAARFPMAAIDEVVARYRIHASTEGRKDLRTYERQMLRFIERTGANPRLRDLDSARRYHLFTRLARQAQARGDRTAASANFALALRLRPWTIGNIAGLLFALVLGTATVEENERFRGRLNRAKWALARGRRVDALAAFAHAVRAEPIRGYPAYLGMLLTILPASLTRRITGAHWQALASGPAPAATASVRQW
jgi:glycosyltransferase involved in cell wall biosynthesis